MKKHSKAIFIVGIMLSMVLGAACWFVLPETVAVQIGFDGNVSSTMPKLPAIIIPVAISFIGGIVGIVSDEAKRKKGALMLCVGIVIMLISLVINR